MSRKNLYKELQKKQDERWDKAKLPIRWAIGSKQVNELIEEWKREGEEIISIDGGGYMKGSEYHLFAELCEKNRQERIECINADKTGEGFIKDMFIVELYNHEFQYSEDVQPTLDYIGITQEQIETNPAIKNGLRIATNKFFPNYLERYGIVEVEEKYNNINKENIENQYKYLKESYQDERDSFIDFCGGMKDAEKTLDLISKEYNDKVQLAIKQDKTGEGFIKDMFLFEFYNYKSNLTDNMDLLLKELNLSMEQINENAALKNGFNIALKIYSQNNEKDKMNEINENYHIKNTPKKQGKSIEFKQSNNEDFSPFGNKEEKNITNTIKM